MKTADLLDDHEDQCRVADVSAFRHFGGRRQFYGTVVTVSCFEDNILSKKMLSEPGAGKVLVIDGQAGANRALLGDMVGDLAISNSWEGIVINGRVRDSAELGQLPLGVLALGTIPRRSGKSGEGETQTEVEFAGVRFCPGDYVYVDEDGLLLSSDALI